MDDVYDIINRYFYAGNSERIYDSIIDDIEKAVIVKALERSGGNQVAASKILGLHRNTLSNKIKKLNIDVERYRS
ncbi:MAG: helix-turn-helix domain-containing protein [Candidatus Omnitrophica bacterium]|nr:helix-turn-helix domain-containing protein [Candidatus Omnitrophota bacterium]